MHEIQASSIETLRQMVAMGLGLAVPPELATVAPYANAGIVMRPLEGSDGWRLLTLIWRKSRPRPEQLQALAGLIRQCLEPLRTDATPGAA